MPIPRSVIDEIDLVFDLRRIQSFKQLKDEPLWTMSRATAWRMIKRVMKKAGIEGKKPPPWFWHCDVIGRETRTVEYRAGSNGAFKYQDHGNILTIHWREKA